MKKQIKTITSSQKDIFDKNVNDFFLTIDHKKNDFQLHYQSSRSVNGIEFHSLMIEITEKDVNPLMEIINQKKENLDNKTNNF